jgi:hypothetical protein
MIPTSLNSLKELDALEELNQKTDEKKTKQEP